MLRSMYAGVSGLNAHQQMMDVTGNNIANVNTVGFKSSRVTFKEMLSQTIQGASAPQGNRAGTNPQQVGLGVGIGSIDTDMSSGNLQSTGKTSDVAIQGDGFFVLRDGSNQVYSRAGNLNFDAQGRLYSSSTGMLVQGWMADANGDYGDFNAQNIGDVTLKQEINAQETDKVSFGKNLDASIENKLQIIEQSLGNDFALTIEETSSFNVWDVKISNGTTSSPTKQITLNPDGTIKTNASININTDGNAGDETYTFDDTNGLVINETSTGTNQVGNLEYAQNAQRKLSVDVFDSQGAKHTVQMQLEKIANNEWQIGNLSVDGIQTTSLNYDKSHVIEFDSEGNVKNGGNLDLSFTPAGTAESQTVALNFSDMTQFAGDMTANFTNVNGYKAGALESFSFTETGDVVGSYSNGLTQTLAKLGLANFSNPSGLLRQEGVFQTTSNSGDPELGPAAQGGFGSLAPATLEMSNANLSQEFTNMITAQRGFQANSKLITTSDEMLQTLVNLKR
ncbi:MAG: flagellar hook protein FlgE [Halanaerobium sp.]|uniref:Flagellar hook protein FlgE n=1 Tax=Halanaerobium saccharolyticum TaxID=43595 RepID=A0A4R6RR74_9FIRM|nr:flagellar hook protein FlgE [Halanaerobium saccharolyticum]PUU95355.1 MAG: flagellar hook protein FlgE [Halanaerobium sp.]TDP89250.1 flagellar hook protein FlgE [Halanaerobium saccharolyticum]